jgi:hypothetical protein
VSASTVVTWYLIIWAPALNVICPSNTFWGGESGTRCSSGTQLCRWPYRWWYLSLPECNMTCDLTFCFVSMLKIWSVRAARVRALSNSLYCNTHSHILQGEKFVVRVHYGGICAYRSSYNISGIRKVNADDFILLIIRFCGQGLWNASPCCQLPHLERSCTHDTHLQHYNKAQHA